MAEKKIRKQKKRKKKTREPKYKKRKDDCRPDITRFTYDVRGLIGEERRPPSQKAMGIW